MANRIAGITVKINGDATNLTESLADVNKNIYSTQSQLRDVEKLLKLDPTNTELLAQKQRLLTTEISDIKSKLEVLKTAAEAANTALEKGEISQSQYEALQREIVATEQQLRNLESQADASGDELNEEGDAAEDAAESTQVLEEASEKLSSKFDAVKVAVGNLISDGIELLAEKLKDTASDIVETGKEFTATMSEVEALSGASGKSLESLESAAREAGKTTVYSASEAAEALKYMALAGWDVDESTTALTSVLNLAAASGMDLGEASDIVTDYLSAFGKTAEDAAQFSDSLAYAQANSNTTTTDLGEAFKNCAATATQLGYSYEDTTAALMVMADAGIKGGEAGTGLSSIMTRLGNNTSNCRDVLAEYGVEVYDADGNVKSLSSILAGMQDVWADLTDEEKANLSYVVAGKTAQSQLMTVLGESTGSFAEYAAGLADCSGAAEEMANVMNDNLSGDITKAQSAFEDFQLTVYDDFEEPLREAVQYIISDVIPKLLDLYNHVKDLASQFWNNIQPAVESLQNAFSALKNAFQPVIDKISELYDGAGGASGIVDTLADYINTLAGCFENIVTDAAPFISNVLQFLLEHGQTVIGIITGIAAAVLAYKGYMAALEIPTLAAAAAQKTLNLVMSLNPIGLIIAAVAALVAAFIYLWNNCEDFRNFWINLWEKIKDIWDNFQEAFQIGMDTIKNALDNFVDAFRIGANAIKNKVTAIKDGIVNGFKAAKDYITNLADEAWSWGTDIINGIVDGIKSRIQAVTDAVSSIADTISSFLHFSVPDKGALTDFESWMPDFMQGLANGIEKSEKYVEQAVADVAGAMSATMQTDLQYNLDSSNLLTSSSANMTAGATYITNDNSRTIHQTNNSPKNLSRLEIYRQTRNALKE